ncbi:MAG TPA: TIGR03435 family protein [Bryobacteraceae bacterium]|nr:TIGR03435 family protein [Bryobacteraceae bacterium]
MKKFRIVLFAALAAAALHAQNIIGTWQGTLKAGPQELRTVYKISLEDDKLKAVMYIIDQGGQPINASSIEQDGSSVKIKIAPINGTYDGKLSADGNTITGTWEQLGMKFPLTLVRATPETEWNIPAPLPPPQVMPTDAKPSFEVSTIKPAKPGRGFSLLVNRSGMLNTTSTSLSDLIKFAYDLHPRQITKGPAWLETEKFDITAKPDTPGIPNGTQLKAMVQKLLAERFELAFHREKKELSVYAITIAKGRPKLEKSDSQADLPSFGMPPGRLLARNATMTELAHVLQANVLDQPVVDQTGLGTTRYNLTLQYTPDAAQRAQLAAVLGPNAPAATAPGDPDAPPDLFTAFQQQAGLRLESTKAPVDVLVIDKAEKPNDN